MLIMGSKCLSKRTLEDSGDSPMSNYLKRLEKVFNATSIKRGFLTIQFAVTTCEQTKKGLSNFYPKRKVEQGEIHTHHRK